MRAARAPTCAVLPSLDTGSQLLRFFPWKRNRLGTHIDDVFLHAFAKVLELLQETFDAFADENRIFGPAFDLTDVVVKRLMDTEDLLVVFVGMTKNTVVPAHDISLERSVTRYASMYKLYKYLFAVVEKRTYDAAYRIFVLRAQDIRDGSECRGDLRLHLFFL